jgi:hypothetical protein
MADISSKAFRARLRFAAGGAITAGAAIVMLWIVPDNRAVQTVAMVVWCLGLGWIIRNAQKS